MAAISQYKMFIQGGCQLTVLKRKHKKDISALKNVHAPIDREAQKIAKKLIEY